MKDSFLKNKRVLLFSNLFPSLEVLEKSIIKSSGPLIKLSPENSEENYTPIDLLDTSELHNIVKQNDVIVFPYTKKTSASLNQLHNTDVRGLQNLLNICIEIRVSKFILINDISYFGFSEKRILYDEDSIVFGDDVTPSYMRVQQLMVEEIYRACQEGLDCSIITIGSNEENNSEFISPFRYQSGIEDLEFFFNEVFSSDQLDLRLMSFRKEIQNLDIKKKSGFWSKLFDRTPKINRIELDNSKTNIKFSINVN